MVALGPGKVAGLGGQHDDRDRAARRGGIHGVGKRWCGGGVTDQKHSVAG